LTVETRGQSTEAQQALEAARKVAVLDGNCAAAIKQYEAVVTRFAKTDRPAVAQALLGIAGCQEKISNRPEAQKTYARIVSEYRDQATAVTAARAALEVRTASPQTNADPNPSTSESSRLIAMRRDNRAYSRNTSIDGRFVAFTLGNRVGLLDTATDSDTWLVTAASPAYLPLMSPDGRSILYRARSTDAVVLVDIATRTQRELLTGALLGSERAALIFSDWSRDGRYLLVNRQPSRVALLSVADGSIKATFQAPAAVNACKFSPDGMQSVCETDSGSVVLLNLTTGDFNTIVAENAWAPLWNEDGNAVFFHRDRGGSEFATADLWSVPVSLGKLAGSPRFVRKASPILVGTTHGGSALYRVANSTRDVYTVDVDPESGRASLPARQATSGQESRSPVWAPDGQRFALVSGTSPQTFQLGLHQRGGGLLLSLQPQTQVPLHRQPQVEWFADGRWVLAELNDGSFVRIDCRTGTVQPLLGGRRLMPVQNSGRTVRLSRDGKSLFYLVLPTGSGPSRIAKIDLETGDSSEVAQVAADALTSLAVSADGRQLAFVAREGLPLEPESTWALMIVPADGGDVRTVHRVKGLPIRDLAWARDGKRLFYASGQSGEGASLTPSGGDIWTVTTGGGDARPLGLGLQSQYSLDVHPSGRQLMFMEENYRNELWMVRLPAVK
jgi:Tol biopolymer transport system component